jgi:endo-1,3(4)-beta-glucanase
LFKQTPNYPIQTNKFYSGFYLGGQASPSWTHPYSVAWSKGGGNAASFGLAVSHIDADQKVIQEPHSEIPGNPCRYFFSPVGIQSLILSAAEVDNATVLTTDTLKAFSVNVNLQARGGGKITFPLLQGM